MARLKLQGGVEVDVATVDDLDTAFDKHRRLTLAQMPKLARMRLPFAATAGGLVGGGASGNGLEVIKAPPGQRLDLLRVGLYAPGTTPAAPLATGWLELRRNDSTEPADFFFPGSGTTVAPALYTDGDSCVRIFGGEVLYAYGAGLPANQALILHLLYRIVPDVNAIRKDPETSKRGG